MFSATEALKITASWLTNPIWLRSERNCTPAMSCPSISTWPVAGS